MPTRRLPNSATSRIKAMRTGKERKDAIPAPLVIPYSAGTITKLDVFYPAYKLKVEAMENALQAQTNVSGTVRDNRQMAEWLISDFFSNLQSAVRRKLFNASVRTFYGLAVSDAKIPVLNSEADISFWGDKAATGEAARIAAGGVAITFPAIAEVTAAVTNFKNPNMAQAAAKEAYDAAQEAVEADHADADKLVLKMWNETEAAFDEGNKSSMRRKAREWGVVYVPTPGEALSPDDFSITGKITDSVTGTPVGDAVVLIVESNTIETTDCHGNFYIPVQTPGTYTIKVFKNGYRNKNVSGVSVVAGEIAVVNIQVTPGVNTGTVKGKVLQGINTAQATITVEGTALSTTTDPMGTYELTNVPEGNHNIKATLISNPAIFQTLPTNVAADDVTTVDFNLP
ncbi:MAG: carboxypeptidase regulatory-like domain-containing protein [Bacteroidetes bacterium]|nr:carboxypeptidase regulatory-like domain-containing protein [Bacteroidota bacterium]